MWLQSAIPHESIQPTGIARRQRGRIKGPKNLTTLRPMPPRYRLSLGPRGLLRRQESCDGVDLLFVQSLRDGGHVGGVRAILIAKTQ